jgi:hypothetical protein
VFVSYKREDELRALQVVQALRAHGLEVWSDQSLPGGESWRANIEKALDGAGCVVVLWSAASVGEQGAFVRDEAGRGAQRGILVPVLLDRVAPPVGFGEIQAIDLSAWRGNPRDPTLHDLVAAARAKLEGRAAPPARGPTARLVRRLTWSGVGGAAVAGAWAIGVQFFGLNQQLCTAPFLPQPGFSDLCGAIGIGGRASREERLAWEARPAGSCDALRAHIAKFKDGAYRSTAADLLTAAKTERATTFAPAPREVKGYVRQSEHPFADEAAARADATRRAETDATSLTCAPRPPFERLAGASIRPLAFDCRADPRGGTVCALDYSATCGIEAQALVQRCD